MSRNILTEYMYTGAIIGFQNDLLVNTSLFHLIHLISTGFSHKGISIHMKFFQRINLITFSTILFFFDVCEGGEVFVCLLICICTYLLGTEVDVKHPFLLLSTLHYLRNSLSLNLKFIDLTGPASQEAQLISLLLQC